MKNEFKQAVDYLNNSNFTEALGSADKLSFDRFNDFLLYCKTESHWQKTNFWKELIKCKQLPQFFNYENACYFAKELFSGAITNDRKNNVAWLITSYPELAISAIRLSKAFVQEEWFLFFQQDFQKYSNDYLNKHLLTFELIRKIEAHLWEESERWYNDAISFFKSPIELLNYLAIWYEINTNQVNFEEKAAYTVNVALEFLVAQNHFCKFENFTVKESILLNFNSINKIIAFEKNEKTFPIFNWLDSVCNWIDFKMTEFDTYCFDLNFEPLIDSNLKLRPVCEKKYNEWKKNGEKILYAHEYYKETAWIGLGSSANQMNIEMTKVRLEWYDTFNDSAIIASDKSELKIENLVGFINEYCGNSFIRWTQPIAEYNLRSEQKADAQLLLSNLIQNINQDRSISWLRFDEYDRISERLSKKAGNDNSQKVLKLLIRNLENSKYIKGNSFDRYDVKLNIFAKPFIRFGNSMISFTSILAQNDYRNLVFTSVLNKNLDNINQKDLASKFESTIGQKFKQAGFIINKAKDNIFDNPETGERGDIDVIAYKNGYLFIIEAKLAHQRFSIEEASEEYLNAFIKGASQLSKALRYISSEFSKFKDELGILENSINDIAVVPLIVSTSFENDHEFIKWNNESYLKITWFELMQLLNSGKEPKVILEAIESDKYWKYVFEEMETNFQN